MALKKRLRRLGLKLVLAPVVWGMSRTNPNTTTRVVRSLWREL